ncbi:MAG TPA: 30S ribosomal protein S9 [Candidatus Nanoarchaeia archaeon]|nr:30S ribosomal protein S9 [Candidatus Nanoarchaeia archaeon]
MKKVIVTQGKRKKALARAKLYPGTGKVIINGQSLRNYSNDSLRLRVSEPFILAGRNDVDLAVTCRGGGENGQADAIRLAIARALVQDDKKLKKTFDEYDRLLLVADVRRNETCKPNDSKPRDKRQKSYR